MRGDVHIRTSVLYVRCRCINTVNMTQSRMSIRTNVSHLRTCAARHTNGRFVCVACGHRRIVNTFVFSLWLILLLIFFSVVASTYWAIKWWVKTCKQQITTWYCFPLHFAHANHSRIFWFGCRWCLCVQHVRWSGRMPIAVLSSFVMGSLMASV